MKMILIIIIIVTFIGMIKRYLYKCIDKNIRNDVYAAFIKGPMVVIKKKKNFDTNR